MVSTLYRLGILFGAAFVAMLVGARAHAADDSSQTAPVASSLEPAPSSNELQAIVVTALRREENIQNVPISMVAMSQKTIDELHIQDILFPAKRGHDDCL